MFLTEESKLQLFESLPKTRNNPPAKKNLRLVMTGTILNQKLKIYAIPRSDLYNIKNKKSLLYLDLNYNSRDEMTVDTILIADRLLVNFKKCEGLFLSQTTLMSSHTVSSPVLDAKM